MTRTISFYVTQASVFVPGVKGRLKTLVFSGAHAGAGSIEATVALGVNDPTLQLPPNLLLSGDVYGGSICKVTLIDDTSNVVVPVDVPLTPTTALFVNTTGHVTLIVEVPS